MSTTTMSKHEPPSPAPSGTTELQYGLHHLVQHNANFQHQADQYGADDGAYLNSEPRTRYGTPDPSRYVENQLGMGTSYEGTYQNPGDPGLGVPFVSVEPTCQWPSAFVLMLRRIAVWLR